MCHQLEYACYLKIKRYGRHEDSSKFTASVKDKGVEQGVSLLLGIHRGSCECASFEESGLGRESGDFVNEWVSL